MCSCDKDGLRRLGFEFKGVKGDDPMLGEGGLAGENRNNSSTFSFVREGDCEGSKGGAKVLREDRGVRGNMESGSGESELGGFDLGGDVVGVVD